MRRYESSLANLRSAQKWMSSLQEYGVGSRPTVRSIMMLGFEPQRLDHEVYRVFETLCKRLEEDGPVMSPCCGP
jgi:hypothetical protein